MKRKSRRKIIMAAAIAAVAVTSAAIYMVMMHGRPFRGRFPMDQAMMDEAREVFENAGSPEDVMAYCEGNMMACGYYCGRVDPGNEMCAGLNFTAMPDRPNMTGRWPRP